MFTCDLILLMLGSLVVFLFSCEWSIILRYRYITHIGIRYTQERFFRELEHLSASFSHGYFYMKDVIKYFMN